jgi:hypothetical protein
MVLRIHWDIPGSIAMVVLRPLRSHQLFGSGTLPELEPFSRTGRLTMMLQEREITKMMVLTIKDWDTFQRVLYFWRRHLI